MKKPNPIRAFLIDIEGVLVRDKRYRSIAGSVEWLTALVADGVPFCLVSNNTTHRPAELIADLGRAGFPVAEDHLVGALDLGRLWLTERGRRRICWLGDDNLSDYWRELGFELVCDESCEAVVLGANAQLSVTELEQAIVPLMVGRADLLCLHRNPFFLDGTGVRRLGPGAWAAALETVVGEGRVITVGKPSEKIYNEAIKRIGVDPAEVLFISDDPVNDLVTAGRLGMATAFVLSGKHADHAVLGSLEQDQWPDIICNSLDDIERPPAPTS